MYFGAFPFWNGGTRVGGRDGAGHRLVPCRGRHGSPFSTCTRSSAIRATPDATVNIDFVHVDGTTVPSDPSPPAGADGQEPRQRLRRCGARSREAAVSTRITSDLPIVAERAMYWPGGPRPVGTRRTTASASTETRPSLGTGRGTRGRRGGLRDLPVHRESQRHGHPRAGHLPQVGRLDRSEGVQTFFRPAGSTCG